MSKKLLLILIILIISFISFLYFSRYTIKLSNINQALPNITLRKYNYESWKTILPKTCIRFSDGCNFCTRVDDGGAFCTRRGCGEYSKPICLDQK